MTNPWRLIFSTANKNLSHETFVMGAAGGVIVRTCTRIASAEENSGVNAACSEATVFVPNAWINESDDGITIENHLRNK